MTKYKEGDTIEEGVYKGFVVRKVTRGWYHCYHPSNVQPYCNVDEATTRVRWFWAEEVGPWCGKQG